MKKTYPLRASLLALFLLLFALQALPSARAEVAIVEGEVMVKYFSQTSNEERKATETEWNLELVKYHSSIDAYHYRFSGPDTWLVIDSIKKSHLVFFAEPNYLRNRQSTPDDEFYKYQWYLPQIRWDTARDEFTGRNVVTVAVIDSGVSKAHGHLLGYLLQQGEWDFADGDADANDESGHGTMVAGIITGNTGEGEGVAGICNNARILPIRVFDNAGFIAEGSSVDASVLISALDQARLAGAKVVNLSLGGAAYSYFESLAVEQCQAAGMLLVCAAGNGGRDGLGDNNNFTPTYPASYSSDCILSVAATDEIDALTVFSNYGNSTVDIAAPGQFIVGCDVPRFTLYEWDFNSGSEGWQSSPVSGYGWVWDNFTGEWGLSTRGSFYSYFAGFYAPNSSMFLTSPDVDLRGAVGARVEFDVSGSLGYDDYISLAFLDSTNASNYLGIICYPGWNYGSLNWDISAFDGTIGKLDLHFKADFFGWGTYSSGIFTFKNIRVTVLDQSAWAADSIWYSQGTSFSAPVVSGVAAALLSQAPNLTAAQVKNLILTSARPVSSLNGKLVYPAVVDYAAALRAAKASSPPTEPTPSLEYLDQVIGTWKGTQTVYRGGFKVAGNFTTTYARHGQRGLYITTKVEIPGQPAVEGFQYLYDNGQTSGGFLPGTQPGADFSFSGSWVSQNRTMNLTITANLNGDIYSQQSQSSLVDKNTLNVFSTTSRGDKALGTALKVATPTPTKSNQTIAAFTSVGTRAFGSAFNVTPPTASSGLPVVLTVKSGPATISANNTVTPTGLGTVVLVANQVGDANYKAAPEVTTSFVVGKGNQTISGVTSTLLNAVGSAAYSLNATASSGLKLSYKSSNTKVAKVATNGTVTIVKAGTAILTVSQAGDANYNAATSVTQVLTVASTVPLVSSVSINGTVESMLSVIINATNSPTNYAVTSGTLPSGLSLNATTGVISGIPIVATNRKIMVIRATNASGNGTGNVTFKIAKGSQTISGVTSTLSKAVGSAAYSLNATASSGLKLSYKSSNTKVAKVATNGTVTIVKEGTAILTVSQAGNANYNAASSVKQTLTVTPTVP